MDTKVLRTLVTFLCVALAFVFSEVVFKSKVPVAYLCLVLVGFYLSGDSSTFLPEIVWLVCSLVYWTIDVEHDDDLFKGAATVLYIVIIGGARLFPTQLLALHEKWYTGFVVLLVVFPFECNNLFLHPYIATGRLLLFVLLREWWPEKVKWTSSGWVLFAMKEIVLPLLLFQIILEVWTNRYGDPTIRKPVLPVVRTSEPEPEPEPEDDDDNMSLHDHELAEDIRSRIGRGSGVEG